MAEKNGNDSQLLRMACDQGLISETQYQALMAEHRQTQARGTPKTPSRIAIETGVLSEEATRDLETQAWIRQLPQQIDGYRLVRLIGRGGMAVVFQAEDTSLGKAVAVKMLLPEFSSSDTYLARFHREARIAARLTHPNTVQVFRAGETGGVQYLVMEFVEGETLSEFIKTRGRVPEAEALSIARQIAGALAEASELGIVHRDVKPANILLSKWGVPKLADFGIAREFTDIADPKIQMSLTMGVVGTPTYMSPEQAKGARRLDFRSDIYSLGATLYHMVIGHVPFFADTPQETMVRVVSEAPRPPRSVLAELSEGAAAVICRMMAKSPDERYDSFDDLISDLEAAAAGDPVSITYREAVRRLVPSRRDDGFAAITVAPEQGNWRRIAAVAGAIVLAGVALLLLLSSC